MEVFVLLADSDGTMHSKDEPWGVAVTSEEEAQRYVRESKMGYSRSYTRAGVFRTYEEALRDQSFD